MRPDSPPDAAEILRLRLVCAGMITGVVLLGTMVAVLAGERPARVTPTVAWLLCGAALLPLAISVVLDASTPGRRLAVLGLREATGLVGAVTTLLTGDVSWVAALGGLSVVALAAGLPRGPALTPR